MYVEESRSAFAAVGLVLNVSKSMVLPAEPVLRDAIPEGLQALACAIPRGDAMDCLGVPIGSAEECRRRVKAASARICDVVQGIGRLNNPIHVVQALRHAGAWSRAQYLEGAVGFEAGELASLELADFKVLRGALGQLGDGLDGLAWEQAKLPVWCGGLGISGVRECAVGFQEYMTEVLEAAERGDLDAVSGRVADRKKEVEAREKGRQGPLLERMELVDRVRVRELAHNRGAALSWISRPVGGDLLPRPAVASVMIAVILGMPLFPQRLDECPGTCRVLVGTGRRRELDVLGVHVHECSATKIPRHNWLRDGLYRVLTQALPSTRVVCEGSLAADGRVVVDPSAAERPIDLGVLPRGCGGWRCIDFRGIAVKDEHLLRAAVDGKVLAEAACTAKAAQPRHRHWVGKMDEAGHKLVAGGFGPFGGLSKSLHAELRQLGRLADVENPVGGMGQLQATLPAVASLLVQRATADAAVRLRAAARVMAVGAPTKWADTERERQLAVKAGGDVRLTEWLVSGLLGAAGASETGGVAPVTDGS